MKATQGNIAALKKAPPGESRARKVTGLKASAYGSGIADLLRGHHTRWQAATAQPLRACPSPGKYSPQQVKASSASD
jgi:hypothetical protein